MKRELYCLPIVLEECERKKFVARAEDILAKEWEIMEIEAAMGTAVHRAALSGEEADP